jgi:serine/threonine protein kinase
MGTAIARRYVLIDPIGYGGISVVYRAIDTVCGMRIALKLLAAGFADEPLARARVHREALITDRLRGPSVPRVYDYGDARLTDGSTVPYVSMELLAGTPLADRLATGPLPWPEAVRVARSVADALAEAHRHGVVHRDLRPENIMMTGSGPKIIDFGEAATVEPGRGSLQPAEDVYGLGVLLYRMLTAGPAHRPGQPAPTPVLLVPGMPRAVAEICRACMAKRPAQRPEVAEVATALWDIGLAGAGQPRPQPVALPQWHQAVGLIRPYVAAGGGRSKPYSMAFC